MDQTILVPQSLTILQVLPALESGGVERGTLELAKHLVQHGHRSLVMSAGGRLVLPLTEAGSEHFCWPIGKKSFRTLLLVRALRRFLIEQAVDVLHVRSRLPAWICYLAWQGMDPDHRPRLVTTAHGFYSTGFYSSVMTRGETVIAVSDAIATYLRDNYTNWDSTRLRIIPRGIDPSIYNTNFRPSTEWLDAWNRQFPQCTNRRLIVIAGRLTRLKGHHDFIHLISRLIKTNPDIHGLIVGEADSKHQNYLAELKSAVNAQGLENSISFTGHRTDLREIFSISSLALSLSTQAEAFGRTVLEALALGTPVVAYARGGVEELLDTLYPEGKVEPDNRQKLLNASISALAGAYKAKELPGKFQLNQMLESTLATYEELYARQTGGEKLALSR